MFKSYDGSDDKFGNESNRYATARPSYPRELVEHFTFSIPTNSREWALDVAAGSGQLSVLLSDYFEQIIATDKSEEQLKQGKTRPNIAYCAGIATKLPRPDNDVLASNNSTFDAITCAQAYHWFIAENTDKAFLEEACRVLNRDHGRIGIFGYGICSITSSERLENVFKGFYYNELGSNLPPSSPNCHWNIDRRLLDNCLEGMETHGIAEIVERRTKTETRQMAPHKFLDYIRTFSALSDLRKACARKGEIDPMEKLHKEFESAGDESLDVNFPFFLIVLKPCR